MGYNGGNVYKGTTKLQKLHVKGWKWDVMKATSKFLELL